MAQENNPHRETQDQIKQAVAGAPESFAQAPQQDIQSAIPEASSELASQQPFQQAPQQPPQAPQLPPLPDQAPQQAQPDPPQAGMTQELSPEQSGMSQSMMSSSQQFPQEMSGYPQGAGELSQDPYADLGYQQYDSYQSSVSPDTMSEIAESIVAEKLSPITNKIEKTFDFKNTFETKISLLDDRLSRIEKIIDKLQLSILEKVGQYVADVSDLKKELQETQKTFKSAHKRHKK
tara:strand:- start:1966 stop:2667 length:702 start_codon:yes stop_codon:yes gene_type:complete